MDGGTRDVRISVQGLVLGMYVSRLDRPWLETPFPMEGLMLDDQEDLVKLQRICSHVWVDPERGTSPDMRFFAFEAPPARVENDEFERLRKTRWSIETEFRAELQHAEKIHSTLQDGVAEVMRDLQDGKKLDLDRL